MAIVFERRRIGQRVGLSVLLGLLSTAVVFLLVPLTQIFQDPVRPPSTIQAVEVAVSPPPPPPPETPPPPPETEEQEPPELKRPPPLPTMEQLELSLNPGVGGDFSIGTGLEMDFETESATEMMELFEFEELDEVPRILREGRFQYPAQFRRSSGTGYVELLIIIDRRGRVSVSEVLDFSHPEFIDPVKSFARDTRFSAPVRNGETVRAKYSWKVEFPLRR